MLAGAEGGPARGRAPRSSWSGRKRGDARPGAAEMGRPPRRARRRAVRIGLQAAIDEFPWFSCGSSAGCRTRRLPRLPAPICSTSPASRGAAGGMGRRADGRTRFDTWEAGLARPRVAARPCVPPVSAGRRLLWRRVLPLLLCGRAWFTTDLAARVRSAAAAAASARVLTVEEVDGLLATRTDDSRPASRDRGAARAAVRQRPAHLRGSRTRSGRPFTRRGIWFRVIGKGRSGTPGPGRRKWRWPGSAGTVEEVRPAWLALATHLCLMAARYSCRCGGDRLDRRRAWEMIVSTARSAGIQNGVSPHTLRHFMSPHLTYWREAPDLRIVHGAARACEHQHDTACTASDRQNG